MIVDEPRLDFVGAIGKGGFGSIYLANLRGADGFVRRVAVKVLRFAGAEDAAMVARQRDEARLLGLLSHEAIVQVIDQCTVFGRPAVIMEYVEGVDVHELARAMRAQHLPFSPRAALEVVAVAAGALDAAWSSVSPVTGQPLRVIHRDIKPGNLIVTPRGAVKVLDFGIARAEFNRDGVTRSAFFGTPSYMAPEFWVQEPIGPAYDVFALGVSLLELWSGAAPERAPMEAARCAAYFEERVRALPVPEAAQALLLGMLAFDAASRCTAAEVHERALELVPALDGEPLARLARVQVPPLLEGRAERLARGEVPTPEALGVGAVGPVTAEVAALTLPNRLGRGWVLALAGCAGVAGVGVVAAVALALGAGWFGAWPAGDAGVSVVVAAPEGEPVAASPVEGSPSAASPVEGSASAASPVEGSASAASPVAASPAGPAAAPSSPASTSTSSRLAPGSRAGASEAPAVRASVAPDARVAPAGGGSPAAEAGSVAPAASATVRTLRFGSSTAGAALSVDGVVVGKTPALSVPVADGAHRIEARLDDRRCVQSIVVGADQPLGYVCDLDAQRWVSRI